MGIQYKSQDGLLTVELSGEIDHHTARDICREIDTKLAIFKPVKVHLDFGGVTFMDSSGLAVVAGRKRMCDTIKSEIYITNISGYPEKILRMSGADKLVTILEDRHEN